VHKGTLRYIKIVTESTLLFVLPRSEPETAGVRDPHLPVSQDSTVDGQLERIARHLGFAHQFPRLDTSIPDPDL
jgi:hypothetical protein